MPRLCHHAFPVFLLICSIALLLPGPRAAHAQPLYNWETGSTQHYFPTSIGKYSIVRSDKSIGTALYGGGTYTLEIEIKATGFWPGQLGFTVGLAGYPLADASFHELGAFADEWAFRGRDGAKFDQGTAAPFGRIVNTIGSRLRIEYASTSGELRIYTRLAGELSWTLEGGQAMLTGVAPSGGRELYFAASAVCWQPCGVEIVDAGVPPKATGGTVSATSGVPYVFAAGDFGFDNQGDGDTLDHVLVASLPATGTLFLDADGNGAVEADEALAVSDTVTKADLNGGKFKYLASAPAEDGFDFYVHDGNGLSASPSTLSLSAELPVELTTFTATRDGSDAWLSWTTASEKNNAGFDIEHLQNGVFVAAGFVAGSGTTLEAQHYRHRVTGLAPGTHTFRLRQIDFDGAFDYSSEVEIEITAQVPFLVSRLTPNPVRDQARFSLHTERTQHVRVEVLDLLGRRLSVVYDGQVEGGEAASFRFDASSLPGGVYLVRTAGERFLDTQRVVVVR